MIRGLLIGILRIIFWVILFAIVSALVRGAIRTFSRKRGTQDGIPNPRSPGSPKPVEQYRDVQDAEFKEVKDKPKS